MVDAVDCGLRDVEVHVMPLTVVRKASAWQITVLLGGFFVIEHGSRPERVDLVVSDPMPLDFERQPLECTGDREGIGGRVRVAVEQLLSGEAKDVRKGVGRFSRPAVVRVGGLISLERHNHAGGEDEQTEQKWAHARSPGRTDVRIEVLMIGSKWRRAKRILAQNCATLYKI